MEPSFADEKRSFSLTNPGCNRPSQHLWLVTVRDAVRSTGIFLSNTDLETGQFSAAIGRPNAAPQYVHFWVSVTNRDSKFGKKSRLLENSLSFKNQPVSSNSDSQSPLTTSFLSNTGHHQSILHTMGPHHTIFPGPFQLLLLEVALLVAVHKDLLYPFPKSRRTFRLQLCFEKRMWYRTKICRESFDLSIIWPVVIFGDKIRIVEPFFYVSLRFAIKHFWRTWDHYIHIWVSNNLPIKRSSHVFEFGCASSCFQFIHFQFFLSELDFNFLRIFDENVQDFSKHDSLKWYFQ